MRRAMRVLTTCALTVGFAAAIAQADRPAIRDAKGSAVSFHRASSQPDAGLRKETLESGQVIYVSPNPVANALDMLDAADGDNGMILRLSGDAASRLANGQVAVMIGGKVAAVGPITRDGQVNLGPVSPEQADRITRVVQAQPSVPVGGPLLTVVPAGQRDGLYLVDVFVQGVEDLRIYQVSLMTGGGTSGRLELQSVQSDRTRADYVFGQAYVVDASSERTGLLVGVLYDGSVAATTPRYLGTYAFRPTPDAGGTFRINVNMGAETLLASESIDEMPYSSGADARIVIGPRTPRGDQ